jgi:hypothetical protein
MDKPPTTDPTDPTDPHPFSVFRELARKLVQVPKAEADARHAEFVKQQAKKPKRGPKPK